MSAGALVCQRAGLEVRKLAATEVEPEGVLAAPPGLVDALLELVDRS
jgi:fructose-1,6-bisphosphatase/inositol monophosphatase family enzyme